MLRPCLGGLGGGREGDLRGRPGWGVEVDDDSEDGIVGDQGDFPSYEYGLDWVDLMNGPDVPLEVSTAFKQTLSGIGGFGGLGRVVVLHHLGVGEDVVLCFRFSSSAFGGGCVEVYEREREE